jgi:hypothetical protein
MGQAGSLVLACTLTFGLVAPSGAQERPGEVPEPSPVAVFALTDHQVRVLRRWLSDMEKWQRYDARWHNRPAQNEWGRIVSRRPPPDPPQWLEAHCAAAAAADPAGLEEQTVIACRLLADPKTSLTSIPSAVQRRRLDAEKPPKHSSFLTRLHIDGIWSTAASNGRAYGLVGSHISLVDVGRLQLFGPPGVLLLSMPAGDGSRRLTLGYTWGVSVRLADVRLFAPVKNMTLFLNVSKVWVNGRSGGGNVRGYDIAGFSLAPRKKG